MTIQQITTFQISADGSSNGQVLASNGTSVYWVSGGTGYDGSVGFTGSIGYTGSVGSQGTTGYTGSKGDIGYTGSLGTTGYSGSAGSLGYTGSVGFTGSKGDLGYTGSKGATGDFGGASFDYIFSTNTTHTSTPNGYFNFNNTAFTSATTLYIDYIDNYGANSYSFLQTIDDSTSTIKGHFSVRDTSNSLNYAMFAITGAHTEDVDHFDVPVSYLSGVTSFTNGTNVVITFARTGNIGDTGYTGSKGDQGNLGYTGSTGAGYDGSQGSIGYTGSAGVGYTGSAGTGGGGGASVTVSATAPVSPSAGNLWWNTETGTMYIYYDDGDTQQWVASINKSTIGATGYTGSAGSGGVSTGKSIAMSMIFGG